MSKAPFPKGAIVRLNTGHAGHAAKAGALAIVTSDELENDRYMRVDWVPGLLHCGQNNGGYSPTEFSLSNREQLQDYVNATEKAFVASRDILRLMPKFGVGDFVYMDNGQHMSHPFKVLSISNGIAFCYRPHGGNNREDSETGTSTWNVAELILRPSLDHQIKKETYE